MKLPVSAVLFFILLVSMLLVAFQVQPAKGGVIIVPDDFSTITEAITHANDGDTISVLSGVYYENITVDKQISLVGESRDTTIIDGDNATTVVLITSRDVSVSGFLVRNGTNGFKIEATQGTIISDNRILNNSVGVLCEPFAVDYVEYKTRNNTIANNQLGNTKNIILRYSYNNLIIENQFSSGNHGVMSTWSNLNTIINNDFAQSNLHGLWMKDSDSNTVKGNTFHNNETAIYLLDGAHPYSEDNDIVENYIAGSEFGIRLRSGRHNVILNNTIVHNDRGVHMLASCENTIRHNHFENNDVGITIRYTSWYSQPHLSDNILCHNNFVNNSQQVKYESGGSPLKDQWCLEGFGNYWSDYGGVDSDSDGVGDSPYVINAYNNDSFPLMTEVNQSISLLPITPQAHFSYLRVWYPHIDEIVTFDASRSFDPYGKIVSYEWDFGDSTYGKGEITMHTYQTEGNYLVSLTVIDNEGLNSTKNRWIEIRPFPETTISFNTPKVKGETNETFSLNVEVSDVSDLYGYDFKLFYKTSILSAEEVELPAGHFLEPDNPANILTLKLETNNAFNSTHGCVWVAVALVAPEEGKNGTGILATITFRVVNEGNCALDLYDTKLADSGGEISDHITLDGYYGEPLMGDINLDRIVDPCDLATICYAYDSTPSDPNWLPCCDIAEPFGIINIYDIVVVAANYGEKYKF